MIIRFGEVDVDVETPEADRGGTEKLPVEQIRVTLQVVRQSGILQAAGIVESASGADQSGVADFEEAQVLGELA